MENSSTAGYANEEKQTGARSNVSVGESDVSITINDSKIKDGVIDEPQLVSYRKIASPNLGG